MKEKNGYVIKISSNPTAPEKIVSLSWALTLCFPLSATAILKLRGICYEAVVKDAAALTRNVPCEFSQRKFLIIP